MTTAEEFLERHRFGRDDEAYDRKLVLFEFRRLRAENARLRALVDRIVPGDPLWPEARAALKVAA